MLRKELYVLQHFGIDLITRVLNRARQGFTGR